MRITAFANPREAIATLAARRGTSLAALSRMLDRDPRYVGRFVREGRPAQLPANDQQRLAAFFGVDARDLGAADETPSARERMLARDRAKLERDPRDPDPSSRRATDFTRSLPERLYVRG